MNITNELLKRISEIDEFKGAWSAINNLALDQLEKLKK